MKHPKAYIADLALLLATFFWGSSFIPVKALVSTVPPYELLAIRFGIMGLLLLPFVLPKLKIPHDIHIGSPLEPKHYTLYPVFKSAIILGILLLSGFAFQTVGMQYTTATNAAFVTGLNVVFVPIFLSLLGHHKPRKQLWFCVIIALVGLAIFSLTSELKINYGDFWVFFCAVVFAFHVIYTSRFTQYYNPLVLACIQFLFTFIVAGIISICIEQERWILLTFRDWANILYLALFATGAALLLQAYFQRYTETTRAALIYTLEPVFAAVLGYLILNEHLTGRQWLGAILILLAMILSEVKIGKNSESRT